MSDSTKDIHIATAMSTSALEIKLKDLKGKSTKHSQILTAKLASSQSGQNLLHIGTSLQTLPPDLHSLLTQLHPVLSCAESSEKEYLRRLQKLVQCGNDIRFEERRVRNAKECAGLYEDLLAAETMVHKDSSRRRQQLDLWSDDESSSLVVLDQVSLLERCAQTTLFLVQELQRSSDIVATMTASNVILGKDSSNSLPSMRNSLDQDSEQAQFLMKLSPRIRRLESDTIYSLSYWTEQILKRLQDRHLAEKAEQSPEEKIDNKFETPSANELQLMIGHSMRGLALLGRGKEVANIFARVAIMPLIRSKISIGRLDEGGPRGECTGLKSLLEDIVVAVACTFGSVLELAEVMFDLGTKVEVDLITDGVWVPIVTALMADAGIKMAVFSPGIASILQSNYTALDEFLSKLASRLLRDQSVDNPQKTSSVSIEEKSAELYFTPNLSEKTVRRAQERIYSHAKTAEFSKKWNLPIYYQLRFGDCCTRLNKAIEETTEGGWGMDVFTGDAASANTLRNVGFELSFFTELYDTLLGLWKPDVIIRPLTNRFLRGAVQLVGRSLAFIEDGMVGQLKFGDVKDPQDEGVHDNQASRPPSMTIAPYCWGNSASDVAAVAWELAILETSLSHDYVSTICNALASGENSGTDAGELRSLVSEVLNEASGPIRPLVDRSWNEIIVKLLIEKCSGVLGAVKGVVATYRMTNRPPPTNASPYVKTILRPLKEFSDEISLRTPDHIGNKWKVAILTAITDRFSVAVEELITTVQKTEVALQSRRTRRVISGGISDGDKVKLQLFLDFEAFCRDMVEVGVDPSAVKGINKLKDLTKEGDTLQQKKV